MLKNKKILVIVGIVIMLLLAGFIMKESRETFKISAAEVNHIIVNDNTNSVKIIKSKDDDIHVNYNDGYKSNYRINENDGVLSIASQDKAVKISFGLSMGDDSLVLEIPQDYNKEITVETSEKCTVDEDIQFSTKNIQSAYKD